MFKNSFLSRLPIRTRGVVMVGLGLLCILLALPILDIAIANVSDKVFSTFMVGTGIIIFILGAAYLIAGVITLIRSLQEAPQGVTQPVITIPGQIKTQTTTIEQELQKAADMLKSGLIDDDEYKELKKKIISKS